MQKRWPQPSEKASATGNRERQIWQKKVGTPAPIMTARNAARVPGDEGASLPPRTPTVSCVLTRRRKLGVGRGALLAECERRREGEEGDEGCHSLFETMTKEWDGAGDV